MYTPIGENFGIIDSFIVAFIAILIVFLVLIVIIAIASLFSKVIVNINNKKHINPRIENKILDEDEDAVAAVIAASIDYYSETKKHARLVRVTREEEWVLWKINGKTFNVLLESVEEVKGSVETEKKVEVKQNVVETSGAKDIVAPIQGSVINVLVKKGQKVKKGEVLLLIEAMKLENEVNAPSDCEIVDVLVEKGQAVVSNQLLVKIK